MQVIEFERLKLKYGDYIWIMDEKGEGFYGYFEDQASPGMTVFKFRNHSNGKLESVYISKLQRLERQV